MEYRYFLFELKLSNLLQKIFRDSLEQVLVYGSRGYGIPKENSDWDLIVIISDKDYRRYNYNIIKESVNKYMYEKVDIYFLNKERWDRESIDMSRLPGQACISGRIIYNKNT